MKQGFILREVLVERFTVFFILREVLLEGFTVFVLTTQSKSELSLLSVLVSEPSHAQDGETRCG